jgi:quercetin dioxygenase-like cupin family protein
VNKVKGILGLLAFFGAAVVRGQDDAGHSAGAKHVAVRPDALKWGPAPATLPRGAEMAVLVGDPRKAGAPFVVRVKMPAGYKVPPHWHPVDEDVTVLEGTLLLGKGGKFDAARLEALPAGSFSHMPRTMRHFAVARGRTVLQVNGVGPFTINYVNSADDPRKQGGEK